MRRLAKDARTERETVEEMEPQLLAAEHPGARPEELDHIEVVCIRSFVYFFVCGVCGHVHDARPSRRWSHSCSTPKHPAAAIIVYGVCMC